MNSYREITDTPGRRRPPLFPRTPSASAIPGSPALTHATGHARTPSTAAPHQHAHADTNPPNSRAFPHAPRSRVPPRQSDGPTRPPFGQLPLYTPANTSHDVPA